MICSLSFPLSRGTENLGECKCKCVWVFIVCITIALNYSNHFHKWTLFSTLAPWLLAGCTGQTPVVWLYRETPVSGVTKYWCRDCHLGSWEPLLLSEERKEHLLRAREGWIIAYWLLTEDVDESLPSTYSPEMQPGAATSVDEWMNVVRFEENSFLKETVV